ncbi:MAG: PAS domain S-box protein [Solirubrobacterales bacterium]|nr:PAS domain S-box protein [Solirubrobacterales bacterium]
MNMTGAPELPATGAGWAALFWEAFTRSKNAMALVDGQRRHVEVNGAFLSLSGYRRSDIVGRPIYEFVVGGPLYTAGEWQAMLLRDHFTGSADLICADGGHLTVDFAGHPALVTGEKLVLFVAIRAVRAGRQHHDRSPPRSDRVAVSKRELEVIQLLALGYSGPEAAHELHLTHNTVRTHVRNAMAKVGARSRAQLVAMALGEGIAASPRA